MIEPADPRNPLHRISGQLTSWTRVNTTEIMPGVQTPLSWTFWERTSEEYMRAGYYALALNPSMQIPDVLDIDHRSVAIFYGRATVNVTNLRTWYVQVPGDAGVAIENFFMNGLVVPGHVQKHRWRYPLVVTKIAYQLVVNPRRVRALLSQSTGWWKELTSPSASADAAAARKRLADAAEHVVTAFRVSIVSAVLGGFVMQWLSSLAGKAGRPDLIMPLAGGYDSIDNEITNDLWDTSRGKLDLDTFLSRWGFRTPLEGELSVLSWREDPSAIARLIETYRSMPDDNDPRHGVARRTEERVNARRELLGALKPRHRWGGKIVLAAVERHLPVRNLARTATIQMLDAARAAIRTIGTDLAKRGVIEAPEDVSYLTLTEVLADAPPLDARDLIEYRRAKRAEYELIDLPMAWIGNPTPEPLVVDASDATAPITGLGVSAGIAEGIARVVLDPSADDIEPGEILVCETTDVSWISYFLVASGVVIDVGSGMSHGAIAAREMGIPCVVSSVIGTRRIKTGDRIRVDGTTGTVEFLAETP